MVVNFTPTIRILPYASTTPGTNKCRLIGTLLQLFFNSISIRGHMLRKYNHADPNPKVDKSKEEKHGQGETQIIRVHFDRNCNLLQRQTTNL